ncbi:hypothetical protein KSS87_000778 [Heliosperma pusillum]|nr:hypothetical protein KSS87_000778 [Heliosperma pusillum]
MATLTGTAAAAAATTTTRRFLIHSSSSLSSSSSSSVKCVKTTRFISNLFMRKRSSERVGGMHLIRSNSNRNFTTKCSASDPQQLKNAKEDIKSLLNSTFCHPILVCYIDLIQF